MAIDPHAEIPRLRTALRDLVALSTIPAAWVGREPPAIVAGLADVLVGSLHLDFAFVRLCDPNGGAAVEVTRGNAWKAFPEWLQHHLAVFGQFSRKEIIPDVGGGMERCRGLLIPIGVNAEGGLVAAACDRTDFPTEIDQLLFSVAANHAATAFQSARLIHERRRAEEELRQARDELEMKVAERTAELRRSEAYSAEAQRLSHTGSFGWKVSSGEIYWSEETFRIFQYDRTTKPTMELVLQRVHPKDAALVKQTIERASQDGKDFDFERRLLMPDGSVKYVHVVAHALSDESGSIEYVGSAMDITEQHQARAALEKAFTEIKKSEDQLRIIIDTIPTLAWCTPPDGSAEFINQRWLDYMGLSAEEARDWGWRVAIHDEDSTELVDTWRAAVATGEPFEAEARLRRADGEYRWFLFRAVPLRDELGNIVQWYGTNTDIEDRKQAEEIRTAQARQAGVRADVSAALSKPAHSGEFLRGSAEAIVRHLDAAFARIWTLNKEKNMLELQASAGMYTHLDGPHSRIPIGIQKIGLIAEEKKPHLTNDVMNDPRVTDKVWAQNEGMVSFAGYPLIVQDRVVGVMAMFARQRLSSATLDILASVADSIAQGIERKRAEEALRKAQVELAHVSRVTTLGELAASIAHEVNQPLAAIVTNGSACLRWLMGDSPNLEEARETARHVIRDGKRASEVINRIRALVRKTDSEKAQLDINQAVEEVVNLTEHEAVRKGVALRTELAGDLPFVVGDRVQLQQVILNLVMNGIEAMDTVTDRPREMVIRSCEHESDQLLVAVQDSGIGLDRQNLEKIFNTFYTTKPRGMGMGLKISRSIVENHGGRLWAVPNDDGPGATFQFTLPAGANVFEVAGTGT